MGVDLARLVAEAIGQRLSQVALKGAFVARLEDLEPLDDADEHFLDDVAGVDRAAGAARQPAASPAVEAREVAGTEQFYGVRIAGTRPQQELERRFVFVHAPGQVDEGLPDGPTPDAGAVAGRPAPVSVPIIRCWFPIRSLVSSVSRRAPGAVGPPSIRERVGTKSVTGSLSASRRTATNPAQ